MEAQYLIVNETIEDGDAAVQHILPPELLQYEKDNYIARIAVFYHFILEGTLTGIWACALPSIQDDRNLTDSALGVAVLCAYLGNVLGTPCAAFLLRRIGSRLSTFSGAFTFGLSLPLIAIAPNFPLLALAMFSFGLTMGIMDVSMNACALLTEIVAAQPVLSSYHGSYSAAAAVSSVCGGILASAGYPVLWVYLSASAVATVLSVSACPCAYNFEDEKVITDAHDRQQSEVDKSEHKTEYRDAKYSERTEQTAPLVCTDAAKKKRDDSDDKGDPGDDELTTYQCIEEVIRSPALCFGAIGFLAAYGEVSMVTWCAIYFDRFLDASSLLSSIGFGIFMLFMALGRFLGDKLRLWLGRRKMVRVGGTLAVCGISLLVVASLFDDAAVQFAMGCTGAAVTGSGLSTLIPAMFSSAGHLPGVHAGSAIAAVASLTYCGSIISPVFTGVLSQLMDSLRSAFIVNAVILSGIVALSWALRPETAFRR